MNRPSEQAFPLTSPDDPAARMVPAASGAYCPVFFFDIAAFGNPARDNDIQMSVRDGLYRILRGAFERIGASPAAYYRQDFGDGVLTVLPPTTSADTVADLPIWLHLEIQRHNKCANPAARIQLRAALDIGPVRWDEHGVYGHTLVHAARLIEAHPAKDALASTDADLVFVVSQSVYDAVIRHSSTSVIAEYRKITARVKESSVTAWIMVAGGRTRSSVLDHEHRLVVVSDVP